MALPTYCDETDAWENSYFHFVESLRTLASPADEACIACRGFNVAGELWLELRYCQQLSHASKHRFSSEQVRLLGELASALDRLPDDACNYTEIAEQSLMQLEHQAWVKPRALAAQLLAALTPLTVSNRAYIYSEKAD
jgi:hypothetical protein